MLNQPIKLLTETAPPGCLLPWLKHEFSLTEKLKKEAGEARLEVLNQRWAKSGWWEKFVLGLSTDLVIHREILMQAYGNACWYARTIIPDYSYQAHTAFFHRLKQESLGLIVFNTPEVKRDFMRNYPVNDSCLEYYWLPQSLRGKGNHFWLRFSSFSFSGQSPFYLVEILLPDFLRKVN
ncbi:MULTISPECIES: chorismate lyase [unclassified Legionella]|uniref:chorismate--pyruvate lyase family protein n=1 Tax=unclassified Legionella TaxID=2622702 RepID=UPI0010552C68|nr:MULTISPECIES: chorismate lyase [unclassified Legionella]MDI9819888.1 chorismate lyase [Legionella sp. PL877]